MNVELNVPDELLARIAMLLAPVVTDALAQRMTDAPEEPWALLTLDQAAARLTRSPRWVRERVKRGDLPHIRLDGGAYAFDPRDLEAFAASRRVSADRGETSATRLHRLGEPAPDAGSWDEVQADNRRVA